MNDRTNKMKSTNSFIQCEELNRLGRFSYNKFNKEIEVCYAFYVEGEG